MKNIFEDPSMIIVTLTSLLEGVDPNSGAAGGELDTTSNVFPDIF